MKNKFAERTTTIKDHVTQLKETDEETYLMMMAEIAEYDKTSYFTRTILVFHSKDLRDMHGPVWDVLTKYLGFSEEDRKRNRVPELPKLEAA